MTIFKRKFDIPTLLIDILLLGIIIAVAWFLIGYYLVGDYLAATYQDWIYHAFRVKTIELYGSMPSWDHIWSNGINHWRSYQYLQHLLVLGVAKVFAISFTKAMLLLTVSIFIGIRVLIYIVLRFLGVHSIYAFLATMVSFTYVQQWVAISDFSIFIAFLVVPFYVFLWIHVLDKYQLKNLIPMKRRRLVEYTLAALSGALWIVHPVVANALGGLFFISIGLRAMKIKWWYFLEIFFVYLIGALPFLLPYLMIDYRFSNPVFTTAGFVTETIAGDYFGLSMYFLAFTSAIWVMIIFMAKGVPTWAKIIITYCSLYFLIIYLARNGYIPAAITQLQISRVIPILALLIVFAFGGALNGVAARGKNISRGAVILVLIISAIAISESIKISTAFTSQPVRTLDDPVSIYFNDKDIPQGSIYVKNVSAGSFFGKDGLRFINSYNEHLLPHPHSVRFSYFMRSEIAYTGVSATQVKLLNDYVTVLGIEYLVLPEASPLVKSLTQSSTSNPEPVFEFLETVLARDGAFSIVRNTQPIFNAYLVDQNDPLLQWDDTIQQPTIQSNSYIQWDESIHALAEKIRNAEVVPLDLAYIDSDKLFVTLGDHDTTGKRILLTQSYDDQWSINGNHEVITSSQVRFMNIDVNTLEDEDITNRDGNTGILLENHWAWWHWPLQMYGMFLVFLLFTIALVRPRIFFDRP